MMILEKVNILILLVTISCIMALSNPLSTIDDIEPQIGLLITFFTRVGLCQLLILLIYWLKGLREHESVEGLIAEANKVDLEGSRDIEESSIKNGAPVEKSHGRKGRFRNPVIRCDLTNESWTYSIEKQRVAGAEASALN
ncbi:MAG: hypothetical protein AAGA70_19410 [Pseudomonadota bacterium]